MIIAFTGNRAGAFKYNRVFKFFIITYPEQVFLKLNLEKVNIFVICKVFPAFVFRFGSGVFVFLDFFASIDPEPKLASFFKE